MYKKIFLVISFLLSANLNASGGFEHHFQAPAPVTTGISTATASAQAVSASSGLVTILQDISSSLSANTNVSALSTILQDLNTGVNSFDIELFEQALQEALQILASGSKLNAFTVIEYTGILIETIAQLEAARAAQASSAVATSAIVTVTAH